MQKKAGNGIDNIAGGLFFYFLLLSLPFTL